MACYNNNNNMLSERGKSTVTRNTHLSPEAPSNQYLFGSGLSPDDRRPLRSCWRHGPAGRRGFSGGARR